MKKVIFLIALGFIFQGNVSAETYQVNPETSTVKWVGTKVTGQHDGHIQIQSGVMSFEGSNFTGGEAVIDMTTLTVDDIKKADSNKNLVEHLNSSDFFDVANHKTATLKVNEVVPAGEGQYELVGDFTIKGITESVPFKANISQNDSGVSATATIKIDRTLFKIKYGSGKFFQGLGDKLIHDDFTLEVALQAEKA